MANIAPFHGVRYNPTKAGDLAKTVAPPYDVINEEQLQDLRERSEHNVIHIDLPNAAGASDESPYTEAGHRFRQWIEEGVLQVDERPAVYAYHQRYRIPGTDTVRDLTGFIAAVRLVRWEEGIVLPHEHTFAKPKEDRLRLMRAGQANFSQVYSFYSDSQMVAEGALSSAMETKRPDMSVQDDDGAEHNVWVVDSPEIIQKVVEGLADRPLYIADGHHRYETAIDYRDELRQDGSDSEEKAGHEYVMMMIVNADGGGLTVLPTHRMVRLVEKPELASIRSEVERLFEVTEFAVGNPKETAAKAMESIADHPEGIALVWPEAVWTLIPKDKSAILAAIKDEASEAWKLLGVTVLHRVVLEQAVQMERSLQVDGEHITYTRDAVEAVQGVVDGECNLACIVNAPSPEVIMEVAHEGDAMPQKSTYFYPKLLTGLVLNDLSRPVG